MRWGVVAGANLGRMSYDDFDAVAYWESQSWAPAFGGGFVLEYKLGGLHELQGSLLFTRLRNHIELQDVPGVTSFDLQLDYVTLPVMWKIRFGAGSPLFAVVGVESGYLLYAESQFDAPAPPTGEESTEHTGELRRWNFSLAGGAGVEFQAAGRDAFIVVQHVHGLSHLAEPDEWVVDWTTMEVRGSVGLLF